MKLRLGTSVALLLLLVNFCPVAAQENITIVAPTSEAAEGLDLHAVAELFKDAENLEEFEKSLNDYELGINNLDLDEDGYVDYIRVVEQITDYTHLIILQVPLGDDDFQDVATIEIEQTEDEEYNMQVHGNEVFYGDDYYVAPTYVHVYSWPIITWIYRPVYRPYRSVFYFGYYPRWWRPYRPVTYHVYRTRTVRYTKRTTFEITRVSRVKTVHRVNYKPRTSKLVKKKVHSRPAINEVKKVNKITRPGEKPTSVKRDVIKTPTKTITKTTVKKDGRKATPKSKTTTIKRSVKKPADAKPVKKTTVKRTVKKPTGVKPVKRTTVKKSVRRPVKSKSVKKTTVKKSVKKPSKAKSVKKTTVKRSVKKPSKAKSVKKTTVKKSTKKPIVKKKN